MAGAGETAQSFRVLQDGYIQRVGEPDRIDSIGTQFKTFDVAWIFMRDYKSADPLHHFAPMFGDEAGCKPTIFRYV